MNALADFASSIEFTPASFKGLSGHFDPEWLEKSLRTASGTALVRKRKLPRELALWLTIGMGLFRDRSIHEVVEHLDLVLDADEGVSPGAVPPARARLGTEPVKTLFELSAEAWSKRGLDEGRWRGLSLWTMDGSCLNAADTKENEDFGRPSNSKSGGAYPQVRVVALLGARNRILGGFNAGPFTVGELTLLEPLWEKVPDNSVTLVDRGLHSWWAFSRLNTEGVERHWLVRARGTLSVDRIKKLGRGDDLVELTISHKTRKKHPDAPEKLLARRVEVRRKGFKPAVLLTSLKDPEKYPASELRDVYVQRWEIELAYDELKTHLLEGKATLRSKTPASVMQEVYGVAVAYNLVRVELARLAGELRLDPRRMSFTHALGIIRGFLEHAWQTSPGALPKRLASLKKQLRLLVVPPRRSRRYPRAVKRRYSKYPLARRRPRLN